jgi:hypothetical protein
MGAQVFDCDHHFEGYYGVSTQIRANDADLTHVTIGPANPDERVPPSSRRPRRRRRRRRRHGPEE